MKGNHIRRSATVVYAVLLAVIAAALVAIAPQSHADAQNVPGEYMSRVERARRLEREISALEEQFAQALRDWLTISQRLADIEAKILDSYTAVDAAEAAVESARQNLNTKLRFLYVEGRVDALIQLFKASDVSEFLTRYGYVVQIARRETDAFREVKDRRGELRKAQDKLLSYKQEAARLARGSDAATIEALISQKKNELAEINSSLIAEQLRGTRSAVPSGFSPIVVYSRPDENGFVRTGQLFSGYSSWYGNEFHGRPTASGERFDQNGFTCAHRSLPFGTWLRVTFRGRSVMVKVNDRGPFVAGRVLDLSRGAAEALGLTGVQWVDCEMAVFRP